jgi:hypothetical protein
VLYLVPDAYVDRGPEGALLVSFPRLRMTRDGLERAVSSAVQFDAHFGLPSSPPPLLRSLWVPGNLGRQWLTARGHPWPAHFQTGNPAPARSAPLLSSSGGGATTDHLDVPELELSTPKPGHEVADRPTASATPAITKLPKRRGHISAPSHCSLRGPNQRCLPTSAMTTLHASSRIIAQGS